MIMYSIIILSFWFSSLIIPFFWIDNHEINEDENNHHNSDYHFMKG